MERKERETADNVPQVLALRPNAERPILGAEHWAHVLELLTETGFTGDDVTLGIQLFIPPHSTAVKPGPQVRPRRSLPWTAGPLSGGNLWGNGGPGSPVGASPLRTLLPGPLPGQTPRGMFLNASGKAAAIRAASAAGGLVL